MFHKVLIIITVIIVSVSSVGWGLPPVKSVETKDGRFLVNGQPFLPIGIYHAGHYHKGLKDVGKKGFNTVQVYGNSPGALREDLDNAYANGMYGLVALNRMCEDLELIEQLILANRDHPGLLVWSLEDEPNIRVPELADKPYRERAYRLPPEKLKAAYELIRRLDPKHPIWLNLCHGILKDHQDYNRVADIKSDDIYPVPLNTLSCVASYARTVVEGASGKPAWLVLQMCPVRPKMGEKDRYPTINEVRCMTYMAVAHGVTGVLYYSFNEPIKVEGWPYSKWRTSRTAPAYWAQWTDLTAELNALKPLILSPEVQEKIEVKILEGSSEKDSWGWPALHLSLRECENSYFLIVANGFNVPVKARLTLSLKHPIVKKAAVRFENRLIEVEDKTLTDSFEPHGVHLYEIPVKR